MGSSSRRLLLVAAGLLAIACGGEATNSSDPTLVEATRATRPRLTARHPLPGTRHVEQNAQGLIPAHSSPARAVQCGTA
jgi:hypothetical protein